jgi:glutathione S-transferase
MPTLYDCRTAPSPRRARIVLAEKGITHETVEINLAELEQLGDAFRAINPRCTVPALVLDDGAVLTDNAAIAAWAEAETPEPPLFGRTPMEKAMVASWSARVEQEGFMAIAEALRNSSPRMKDRALPGPVDYAQIPALAERGRARFASFLDTLDRQLAAEAFVAGPSFSHADILAVVAVDFARVVKMQPGEQHCHIARWRAAMAGRPSISL